MSVRNILLGIDSNQILLIRDQGYYMLVSREPNMPFQYRIVHDYPFMESPDVIRNWLAHHNVLRIVDAHGAIFFIEGFNACWDIQ